VNLASYGSDTSEPFRTATSNPVVGHCDVVFGGEGLKGSSGALKLAKHGGHVAVPDSVGFGSQRTQMARLTGTIAAEAMDGRAELNPWEGVDWPTIPGHVGPRRPRSFLWSALITG